MVLSLSGDDDDDDRMEYQPEKYFRLVAVATEFESEVRYVSWEPDVASQMLLSRKRGAICGFDVAAGFDASSTQSMGDRLRIKFSATKPEKDWEVRSILVVIGTQDWRKVLTVWEGMVVNDWDRMDPL